MKNKSMITMVNIGIILTVVSVLMFPLVITVGLKVQANNGYLIPEGFKFTTIVMITILSIPYIWGLIDLKKICILFNSDDKFNIKISEKFKEMAYLDIILLILIHIINIIYIVFYDIYLYSLTIIPLFIITFILIFGYLFLKTMSHIFYSANKIKEENDLTI